MPPPSQALLKRRTGTTKEEFQESYRRHGHLVLPWCIDTGIAYYAQIHDPQWSSEDVARRYEDIVIEEFDAAAEMMVADGVTMKLGGSYYENVILPDERRILFSEAKEHLKLVEPGSVVGTRVEFVVDGKPTVAFEEWKARWDEYQ